MNGATAEKLHWLSSIMVWQTRQHYDRNRKASVHETQVYRQMVDHDAHHDEGHDLSCLLVCQTWTCQLPIQDHHLTSEWGLRPVSMAPDPTNTEQQLTINQKSNLTHHRKHWDARSVMIKSTTDRKYKLIIQLLFIVQTSDVKRGQNLEAEAEASRQRTRPRPELRGRGQDYAVEAEAKNNYEKNTKQWLTTCYLKLLLEKLTKFPNFTRFLHENAQLHNKTTRSRPGPGQNLKTEVKASRPRPRPKFWPRRLNITGTDTSNVITALTSLAIVDQ